MTKKTFLILRIIVVIVLAGSVSIAVNYDNWYWVIASIIAAWALLYVLRSKVKEVLEDERDQSLAGKAACSAIRIYAILSVVIGIIVYTVNDKTTTAFAVGSTILYSACLLMLFYSVIFKIYERKNGRN